MKNPFEELSNLNILFDFVPFDTQYEEVNKDHRFQNFYPFAIKKQITENSRYIKDVFGNYEHLTFKDGILDTIELNEVFEYAEDSPLLMSVFMQLPISTDAYSYFTINRKIKHTFNGGLNTQNDIEFKVIGHTKTKQVILYSDKSTEYLKYIDGEYAGKTNTNGFVEDHDGNLIIKKNKKGILEIIEFQEGRLKTINGSKVTIIEDDSLSIYDNDEMIFNVNEECDPDGLVLKETSDNNITEYEYQNDLVTFIKSVDEDETITYEIEYENNLLKRIKCNDGSEASFKFKNGLLKSYKDNWGTKYKNPFIV